MSKNDDADLILKLDDLRREATMREARNWIFSFNPTSAQDVIDVVRALFGNPEFLHNLETLVKRIPDSEQKIVAMRERMKKFADIRAERAAKVQTAG